MLQSRRQLLSASLLAAAASRFSTARAATSKLGIPGPYPGRVVAVHHPRSIVSGVYQAEPVQNMMQKGRWSAPDGRTPLGRTPGA